MPRFARVSEADRKMPNGSSGSRLRRSMTPNAASSTAAPAKDPRVAAEAQPDWGAPTTADTSSSIAAVTVTAPGASKRRLRLTCEASRGISRSPATRMRSATGAGSSRVHRQLTSVSRPDSTSPSEKPLAPKAE